MTAVAAVAIAACSAYGNVPVANWTDFGSDFDAGKEAGKDGSVVKDGAPVDGSSE